MTKEDHIDVFVSMSMKGTEEINAIANTGMFNDIIEGYCVIAMKEAGMTLEQIKKVDFNHIFDTTNAFEARQKGRNAI